MTPPMPTPVAEESSEKKIGKRAAADMIGAKLKRTNWGHGKPLERLTKAQIGLGPEVSRAAEARRPTASSTPIEPHERRGGANGTEGLQTIN